MFASVFCHDCSDEKVISFVKKIKPLLCKCHFRSSMRNSMEKLISLSGSSWLEYDATCEKRMTVDVKSAAISKFAIKHMPKFLTLSKDEKHEIYEVIAELYGLDLSVKRLKSRFIITYQPRDKGELIGVKLAIKLGFKVYNLADVSDCRELVKFLGRFK